MLRNLAHLTMRKSLHRIREPGGREESIRNKGVVFWGVNKDSIVGVREGLRNGKDVSFKLRMVGKSRYINEPGNRHCSNVCNFQAKIGVST